MARHAVGYDLKGATGCEAAGPPAADPGPELPIVAWPGLRLAGNVRLNYPAQLDAAAGDKIP